MTADRRAALVERVANAMWEADPYYASHDLARIALDLALDEAAKVVVERLFNASCFCSFEAEAAIRALKGKP